MFDIVDESIFVKETKQGTRGKKMVDASIKALRQLKPGQAIKVPMPKYKDRDNIRSRWSYRTRKVSQEEGNPKAFKTAISDDGTALFIQRKRT